MDDAKILTEFNSNKASLIRVDTLMKEAHIFYFDEDLQGLFKALRNLRIEARYKMNKKQKEELDKKFNNLRGSYDMFMVNKNQMSGMDFLEELDDFYLYLTDFMGERGMLLTDNTDEGL